MPGLKWNDRLSAVSAIATASETSICSASPGSIRTSPVSDRMSSAVPATDSWPARHCDRLATSAWALPMTAAMPTAPPTRSMAPTTRYRPCDTASGRRRHAAANTRSAAATTTTAPRCTKAAALGTDVTRSETSRSGARATVSSSHAGAYDRLHMPEPSTANATTTTARRLRSAVATRNTAAPQNTRAGTASTRRNTARETGSMVERTDQSRACPSVPMP